jgi:multidrug resistance efflux pump
MNGKRKAVIACILIVMVLAVGGIGWYYWYQSAYFVSTEDAKVTGDLVKVSPQITGKLLEFYAEEGDTVMKDQILGRQEMLNLPDSSVDTSLLRAPISGLVVKKQANLGEITSASQTLAMIVDPDKLYINANIEETKLGRLQIGQKVDITVDQYESKKFTGKIRSIGQASNSAFSLLPSSTSGTFTKVVQRIPIKIDFESKDVKLLPGTNAVIKIHIR